MADSLRRRGADRFRSILQSQGKERQTLGEIIMDFRRQPTALCFWCGNEHATESHVSDAGRFKLVLFAQAIKG